MYAIYIYTYIIYLNNSYFTGINRYVHKLALIKLNVYRNNNTDNR